MQRSPAGLHSLYLVGTPVSDVSPLSGLTGLKTLVLYRAQVTNKGVAKLRKALPECRITDP